MEAPAVQQAMVFDATLYAFRALLSASEALDRDEARQITSTLLHGCTEAGIVIDNTREILLLVLALLEQKTQDDNDFATLLLRLVCALKQRMRWPSNVACEVATVVVKLLTRPSIRGSSVELVLQLVREVVENKPELEPEIQLAFAECVAMTHCRVPSWRWRQLCVWELGADLLSVTSILRDGTSREQLIIIKCLLANPRPAQKSFMLYHNGVELTLEVCDASSPAVRELALEFAKDVVTHIPACREVMVNLWMANVTKFEHLVSGGFLEALFLDEVQGLAIASPVDELEAVDTFDSLSWGQAVLIDEEKNESASQPTVDDSVSAIVDPSNDFKVLRNLKRRSAPLSPVSNLVFETLRTGNEAEVLWELGLLERREEEHLVYLCSSLNLVEIIAVRLSQPTTSFRIKSCLWSVLGGLLSRNLPATPNLVAGIQAVVVTALDALAPNGPTTEAEVFQMPALQALRSPLLSSEENREVAVEQGAIPILVRLLAEQDNETPWGRELITALREFAVGPHLGRAHEIDQVVASLCDQRIPSSQEELQPVARYYQNLILLYHDIPGVRLGRLQGIDKVISAAAIMELLRNVRDLEKVLVINYFHNELELHVSDPRYSVGARPELSAIVGILCEKLEDVMLVAIKGPAEAKKLARRMLTVVAASDKASREKLRMYQLLYRPEPVLVLSELLKDCDEDMWQPDNYEQEDEGEEDELYQYSDCDDDGEDDEPESNTPVECDIDLEDDCADGSHFGAYQVDGNGRICDELAAGELAEDWEML